MPSFYPCTTSSPTPQILQIGDHAPGLAEAPNGYLYVTNGTVTHLIHLPIPVLIEEPERGLNGWATYDKVLAFRDDGHRGGAVPGVGEERYRFWKLADKNVGLGIGRVVGVLRDVCVAFVEA